MPEEEFVLLVVHADSSGATYKVEPDFNENVTTQLLEKQFHCQPVRHLALWPANNFEYYAN